MVSKKDKKHLLEVGALLDGRWEIVAHLATGGKGEVYLARQVNLDREVAIKVISPEFMELVGEDEEEFDLEMQRFGREVRAMAQVRHPNVVQVYDHGRRLPTEAELALAAGEVVKGVQTQVDMHSMHTPLPKPRTPLGPVALGESNEYGVRGVLGNVGEWVVRSGSYGAGGPRYALFGRGDGGAPYRILDRPALESSVNVGFRCAKSPEGNATPPR